MSNTTHTPGPWATAVVVKDFVSVIDEKNGQYIADVYYRSDDHGNNETEANARIIAAAPKLLDVLKDLVDKYDAMHDGIIGSQLTNGDFFAAREAIKKAQP